MTARKYGGSRARLWRMGMAMVCCYENGPMPCGLVMVVVISDYLRQVSIYMRAPPWNLSSKALFALDVTSCPMSKAPSYRQVSVYASRLYSEPRRRKPDRTNTRRVPPSQFRGAHGEADEQTGAEGEPISTHPFRTKRRWWSGLGRPFSSQGQSPLPTTCTDVKLRSIKNVKK